jgi:ACS family D-galactonate transporter-like MFS transporter
MSSPSPAPRPTNVRWMIVVLLMGLAFLAHFNRISMPVAGKQHFIGSDKLSEAQMGVVYSAFLLVYTIGMLPGGYFIDRVGPRRAMAAMGVGMGFCTALTGVLGWSGLAVSAMFLPLLLVRGVAGASSIPLHPGAARAVSLWMPLRNRSFANGLITASALVGIAFAYPVFGRLMDRVGWPSAFAICGLTLMVFGMLWYVLAEDSPATHGWTNGAERELVAEGNVAPARVRATFREALGLFRNRSLVLLTLSYGALSYVQYLFFYWIEYYFSKVLKQSDAESRQAAFLITMAMAVGMAGGGWVSDVLCRRMGVRWGSRSIAMAGMVLSAGFSLLGVSVNDPQTITWCFALAMGSLGLCEGIFWTMAPALEPRNGGLAAAVLNTGGNGIGLLAPVFTPLLGEMYGWDSAVVVACVICGVGGVLWLGVSPRPAEEPKVEPTEGEVW